MFQFENKSCIADGHDLLLVASFEAERLFLHILVLLHILFPPFFCFRHIFLVQPPLFVPRSFVCNLYDHLQQNWLPLIKPSPSFFRFLKAAF